MATTPYPFVASTVLTALQLNSTFNIPTTTKTASHTFIAADAGTRVIMNAAGSTSLTLDTSIFAASDVIEIQNIGAGVATLTAGTATVSSAGPLAIPQHGGGRLVFSSASAATFFPSAVTVAAPSASGLTLISSTTIGTTVSSVTVTGAFSATYDNYKIVVSGGVASASNTLNMTLGATTTGYYRGGVYGTYGGATAASAQSNAANWSFPFVGTTQSLSGVCDLMAPNLAKNTILYGQGAYASNSEFGFFANGFLDNTTQYTDFTFTASSPSTLTGGTIKVYGYANS